MESEKTGHVACCRVVSCRLCVNWPLGKTALDRPRLQTTVQSEYRPILYQKQDRFDLTRTFSR